ncbi:GH18583 [Drosophila grimshawi]|uniref:GH18583 n=1 Tax=Drosophila grimshawi TaxID=7222 RepID=B4JHY0_DROGR|nr:GH18583 [Drosophila grimshawi]
MKLCSMNGPSESEVESLLMSPCWGPTQTSSQDQYLLDGHKLLLEHDLDSLPSDADQKNSLDVLDNLLLNSSSLNALSDLKPLPPFTGYTGHLSINGISGHHYHAIAQRLPDESNNNYIQTATTCGSGTGGGGGGGGGGGVVNSSQDQNIVSSSTCLPESVLSTDADVCLNDVKLFADSQLDSKLYSVADSCVMNTQGAGVGGANNNNGNGSSSLASSGSTLTPIDQVADSLHNSGVRIYKDLTEYVDMNSIDDIAAIIGSAIADTTVPNQLDKDEGNDTRDSWMDLDAWIDGNCIQNEGKVLVSQQDALSDFMLPHSPLPVHHASSSTLQSLLSHGYMPLLQNRLQHGPPVQGSAPGGSTSSASTATTAATTSSSSSTTLKTETPSSTSYCNELSAASSSCSPPGSVVSTTDNNLMINPRYLTNNPTNPNQQQQQQQQASYQLAQNGAGGGGVGMSGSVLKDGGLCSPDMLSSYPHTTSTTNAPSGTPKAKRSRAQKKSSQQQQQSSQGQLQDQVNAGGAQLSSMSPTGVGSFSASDLSGLLGKEKPVHRCSICNRGFLNKSNIKVHLRTHTGEKPFRCDVCAKAFRQKAHLLKHQQIHKRIGRD